MASDPHQVNLGYACLNMTLRHQKPSILTSRGCIKATFLSKGLDYCAELGLQVCAQLVLVHCCTKCRIWDGWQIVAL